MNAKEFFERAFLIDEQIESKQDMISLLNDRAGKITTSLSSVSVQNSGTERPMADAVDSIVDLTAEISEDSLELCRIMKEIVEVIRRIDNPEYRLVLEKHYVCGKTFSEIAYDLNLNVRTIYRLLDLALEAAEIPDTA